MTPDWSEDPEPTPYADLSNPQTLNLYAYAGNNPTTNTDADGHREDLYYGDGDHLEFDTDAEYQNWWLNHNGFGGWEFPAKGSSGYITLDGLRWGYGYWTPDNPTAWQAVQSWLGRNQAQDIAESIGVQDGLLPQKPVEGIIPIWGGMEEAASELLGEEAGIAAESAEATRVAFGHGARHLIGTGLDQPEVEAAIRKAAQGAVSGASEVGNFWGRVTVDGKTIEFRAYRLEDGTINVGTYYLKP